MISYIDFLLYSVIFKVWTQILGVFSNFKKMINFYLGKRTQCEQKIIKNIFNLLGNKFNNWRLVWLIITDVQCITLNGTEDVLK